MNLVYGQYEGKEYPLKRYYIDEIPTYISEAVHRLIKMPQIVVRGGLAYILLFERKDYCLKDLDFLSTWDGEREVIDCFGHADEVYVNRNTFGESVVTGFWRDNAAYYKLDVLMGQSIGSVEKLFWDNVECRVVSRSYLWANRMIKIAEKEKRRHTDDKTINHFQTAGFICDYMLRNRLEIEERYKLLISGRLEEIRAVLAGMLTPEQTGQFIEEAGRLLSK